MSQKSPLLVISFLLISTSFAQISVQSSSGQSAADLVNSVFVGGGVQVSNVQFNNNSGVLNATTGAQLGTFSNNLSGFPGLTFSEGLILATGDISVAEGPNDDEGASEYAENSVSCPELEEIAGTEYFLGIPIANEVNYPAVLEFDFMTTADMVIFNYVFASEEYPEFVGMGYNDVFGFFVTDLTTNQTQNVALLPNTNVPVAIDNVNADSYSQYYHSVNTNSPWMQYDAYVGPLAATFSVVPCRWYHLKLAVSNVGDTYYDSAVFLQAQSFSADATTAQMIYDREDLPVVVQDCNTCTVVFSQAEAQSQDVVIPLTYSGTAINGVDVTALPSSVTIPAGQTTASIVVSAIGDFTPDTLVLNIHYVSVACGDEEITITLYVCKNDGIEVTSHDVIVCQPAESISVEVVSGMSGDVQWNPSNMLANPNSLTTGFVSNPTEPTYYTVTVWDRFHCTSSTTTFLYGFGDPTMDTIRATICEGQVYNRYGFNEMAEGTYTHQTQSSYGCDSIITLILKVLSPQVSIEVGSTDLCEDGYVELTTQMSGDRIHWSNGSDADRITVTTPGTYVATVTEGTCIVTDMVNIEVCPDVEIYVPNAFTPSSEDGINDVFQIYVSGPADLEMFEIKIFDRWGMLVFQSNEIHFSWDGTINGKLLSGETYTYYIQLKTKWHKARMFKGIVTVL